MASGTARRYLSAAIHSASGPRAPWTPNIGDPPTGNLLTGAGAINTTGSVTFSLSGLYLSTDAFTFDYLTDLSLLPRGMTVTSLSQFASVESSIQGNPLGLRYISNAIFDRNWDDWTTAFGLSNVSQIWNSDRSLELLTWLAGAGFANGTVDAATFAGDGLLVYNMFGVSSTYPYITLNWSSTDITPVGLEPVTNVRITNEPAREISWDLPVVATGTVIKYIDSDSLPASIYQDNSDVSFNIPGTGNATITLYAAIDSPFDVSEPVEYLFQPISIVIPPGTAFIPIDIAISGALQLITNPSGIYTLVPGQAYDVIYDRVGGTTTAISQTVAIPRPYGITTYIPEEE